MNKEESLLSKIDPYRQALKAMNGVEGFGITSHQVARTLSDLSDAYKKGVADAIYRLHQRYYKKDKMPRHLNQIMEDIYGEDGWFV